MKNQLDGWFFHFQNNSNCTPGVLGSVGFWPQKSCMLPNCLSVIVSNPTFPNSGRKDLTLFKCTSAFSLLAQCRMQMENWNMVNPSAWSFLRKSVQRFLSFLVSVGKSKNTKIHITRYSVRRDKLLMFAVFYNSGQAILRSSPLKHLARLAVV